MRGLLVLMLLLIGGLQGLQASEYRPSEERTSRAQHACCPHAGAHASCCPDACASPAVIADSPGLSLWCAREGHLIAIEAGIFASRGESPLIRPPIF